MNNVVDAMNGVLQLAVRRAGPEAHFIDYDKYVGMTNGRFCEPGVDESNGGGANRPDLFFYQMKTGEGSPQAPDNLENAKSDEEDAITPVNNTLGAVYAAWIETTLEESDTVIGVDTGNANDAIAKIVSDREMDMVHFGSGARFQVSSTNGSWLATHGVPRLRKQSEEDAKKSSSVPDSVARIFHPTRGGHEIIANLILYQMEAVYAGK
jgi:hypothetical protein